MNEKPCRSVVTDRSDRVCEKCGLEHAREKHHRKNRSQGGDWEPSNILDLCPGCHKWITEHPARAYINGWSVRQPRNPLHVPVMYRGALVYLDDLGGLTDVVEAS